MEDTCQYCILFQVLKILLIKNYKIQLSVLFFLVVLYQVSFYISKYHFFTNLWSFIQAYLKKYFQHQFSFVNGYTQSHPHPLNGQNPLSVAKVLCPCSLNKEPSTNNFYRAKKLLKAYI